MENTAGFTRPGKLLAASGSFIPALIEALGVIRNGCLTRLSHESETRIPVVANYRHPPSDAAD
jgi:hypothetical protein